MQNFECNKRETVLKTINYQKTIISELSFPQTIILPLGKWIDQRGVIIFRAPSSPTPRQFLIIFRETDNDLTLRKALWRDD